MKREVWIGCSGWSYDDWRDGAFYPPRLAARDHLRHYATQFDTVELNASFYRLPACTTVERWAAQVPDGFRFAVKVSRYLTHVVRLADTAEHLALLLDRLEPLLAARLVGPLLWQLPPTFRRDETRLAEALAAMSSGLRHAIEFRDPSWFTDEVMSLLEKHGVALVIADRPEVHAFQTATLTTDFTYVRFHHGSRGRRGNYSPGELDEWADRIADLRERVDVWAYFNNDWEAFAPANARELRSRLGGVSPSDSEAVRRAAGARIPKRITSDLHVIAAATDQGERGHAHGLVDRSILRSNAGVECGEQMPRP